ncbi:MAG: MFS transporter [Chromatiales bacterium]|nr:MFS transporter [Chromatiales bacterium]
MSVQSNDPSAYTATPVKLGPIWLMPGITQRNALAYFLAAFFTIGTLAFVSNMQPYLLTENLGIPADERGRATSLLAIPYEIVFLALIGPLGALADRIGRRPIFVAGFLLVATALAMFPLSRELWQLAMLRGFYGMGAACITSMMATVLADYPQERSRGMMLAGSGICNGLGAVMMVLLLSQMPRLLETRGFDALMAGRITFWMAAALAILVAIVLWRNLKPGKPGQPQAREPLSRLLGRGVGEARRNPRIAVACMEAFIARGDLVVVATFLSLWAQKSGLGAGMSLQEAAQMAGRLVAMVSLAQLVFSPIWGYVLDRVDRMTAVAMAMAFAGTAYLLVGLSPDPLALAFIPLAILLGFSEAAAILSGAAVIGQEAREDIRGSVLGLFNFCGSLGTLVIAVTAGIVFDAIMPGAPFVMVAFINLAICGAAIMVRLKTGYRAPDSRTD